MRILSIPALTIASLAILLPAGALAVTLTITTGSNLGTSPIGQDQIPLNATGGTGNYSWSLASGSLPTGLNISTIPGSSPAQAALVGVASAPGSYAFSLTVNDGNTSATQAFTLKITALTVKDIGLPDGFLNTAYSYTLTPLNNAGSVTFAATAALPSGMSLSAAGVLSGTPAAAGTYNIDFSVFDGVDTTYRGYQLTVYTINLKTSGALPNAAEGVAYSTTLSASGGAAGYRYGLTGGSLPPGLSLSAGGTISGTTNGGTGIYQFDVTVTDSAQNSYQKTMSIDVIGTTAQNQITLGPIDDATVGSTYGWQIPICCGGTGPFTWAATGLPTGMSIRWGSGVISDYIAPGYGEIWGVATTPGNYNVTVTVTDSLGATSSLSFPFHVSVLTLAPYYNLQPGTLNTAYSTAFQIIGGSGTYSSVAVINGALPDGLTLNTGSVATGNFSVTGTPLENGGFDPVFKVTDGSGNTLTRNNYFNINNVSGGITINNNGSLGTITTGNSYSNQLSACCVASYIWSVPNSNLPAGLTLSAGGLLSGAPTTAGVYSFLIEAADAAGVAAPGFRLFTLTVTPFSSSTNSLPNGNVGTAYSATIVITGGTGALTFSVPFGYYLPPGLTLSSSGTISGTPTATGQYYVGVSVADQGNHTATGFFGINIYAAGVSLPSFAFGSNFGTWHLGTDWIELGANGGNGTYTWSLVSGTLPPGLALRTDVPSFFSANQQAGLIGVATTPGNYNFTLSVTSGGQTATLACTIRISGLDLQNVNPPDAFIGNTYSYTFNPVANAGTVTFTVNSNSTNGAMPPGLTLSSAGVLSGTPTTAGTYNIAMNIFDGVDTQYEGYTLYVYAVDITTSGVLPNGTQNAAYSTNISASGGTGGYTYTSTGLPNGLTLSSGGTLSGTITTGPGLYGFSVTATDSGSNSYTRNMGLDVISSPVSAMRITNLTFNDPVLGGRYGSVQSICCGGTAPFVWTVTGLPPGLTTEPNSNSWQQYGATPGDVQIYGVAQQAGTFNVQYKVTDATGASTSVTVPMHVSNLDVALPSGSAYNLPNGTIDNAYSATFHVLGGSGPYSFTQTLNGELPDGLAINVTPLTVSGTPLENGSFNSPQFLFADSAGNTLSRYESIYISGGTSTISINGNGISSYFLGTTPAGAAYSTTFSACCSSPYVWTVAAGSSLPPGLSLSSSGQLSGTPTTVGQYTFLIDAANGANVGVKSFELVVTPIAITTSSLPYGVVGSAYSTSLAATGGTGSLAWALTFGQSSALPPGLTLASNGTISGTPTSAGAYNVIVDVIDSNANWAVRSYTLDVYVTGPPLNFPIGPNLGPYAVGFNQLQFQLQATGGTPPYHYSLSPSATVIPGMRVQDGLPLPTNFPASVTGGYLGLLGPGSYSTSLRVTDSTGATFDSPINFKVLPVDIVSQGVLPPTVVGTAYSFQFTPYGGSGTYVWGTSGPPGFSISSTGLLTGTPAAAGTFSFSVSIGDAAGGGTISRAENLTVYPFAITDAQVLPQATAQSAYSHQFSAPSCGTGCTWSNPNGNLPAGLSFSASGLLSGTPTASGGAVNTFTVQAAGSTGTTQELFTLTVAPTSPSSLAVTTNIATSAVQGVPANAELFASGGTLPYTFSLQSGTLPPGITLQGPGQAIGDLSPGANYLNGRPMVAGTYNFTIEVTDSLSNTATKSYSWQVSQIELSYTSLPISTPVSNPAIYGQAYSQPMLVIGGTGNYNSWTTAAAIYPGLSVNSTTGLVSGTPTATGSVSTLWTITDSGNNSETVNVGINVAKDPQTITFGPLNNVTYGASPFAIGATSTSGLAVSLASTTSSVCTYAAGTVTILAAGTCTITASLAGNSDYLAPTSVTQSFTVNQAAQTITFAQPSGVSLGASPFTLSASATSGLAVSFASTTSSLCTVTPTGTVTILAVGTCSITASQPGNSNYMAATAVTQSLTVISGPGYSLTVAVSPSNSGTVTLSPASTGNYYASGTTVCLTAFPAAGQIFIGWTGTAVNAAGCLTMTASASVTANFTANPISATSALRFVPVTPCRLVDTRNADGPLGGPSIGGGTARSFTIPGTCNIPSTALAYSLNLTVVPHGTLGYVSMWPTGQPQPVVSTLNSLDGRIKSNAAIVPAGTGGAVSVFATDTTDAILDINGYFDSYTDPAALQFYPLTPCRVADTRSSTGSLGGPSLLGSQSRSFPILSSACNIPGNALAYSLNFTAIPQGPLGYLTVWPSGQSQPLVSTLNAPTGAVTANAAIVPAGAAGAIELFATDNSDMAIDINGYFAAPASGGLSLYNLTPCRIEDTRLPAGTPAFTGTVTETATGVDCGVPPEAQSLVLNATVVPSGELGYLSLWANGGSQPVVSTLNALDGSITSNMAVVPTTNGLVDAFAAGTTYLILDISGYFAP